MFGEMSLVPATDELRAPRGAAPEPVARGRATPVCSLSDLFEEPPPSHSDAAKERLLPTVASAAPEPARPEHRVKPVFPIGILFYLASIGIVATATVGVLFGIGFSLLVQPTDALGAGAAARSQGSSVRSLLYDLVPNFFGGTAAADTKVVTVPIKPELPRAAALAALQPAAAAQPPAADQMPSPEQNGAAPPSAVADAPGGDAADQAPVEEAAKQAEAGGTTDAIVPVVVTRDPPSSAAIPAATVAPSGLPAVDVAGLLARGDGYLGVGDVTSARLFYERAADAGSGQGAMRLRATFDPSFLGRAGLVGTRGDQGRADMWYHRARGLDTAPAAREPNSRETK